MFWDVQRCDAPGGATYTLMALLITLEEAHGRPSLLHDMAVSGILAREIYRVAV